MPARIDARTQREQRKLLYSLLGDLPTRNRPIKAKKVAEEERESYTLDALSSAYDVNDLDRDGVAAASDCNDANADVQHAPVETAAVALAKVTGAVRLSWTSQDPSAGVAIDAGRLNVDRRARENRPNLRRGERRVRRLHERRDRGGVWRGR